MTTKPAIEARMLLDDPRYETWSQNLTALRDKAQEQLKKRGRSHEVMAWWAGAVNAFDEALGLRSELSDEDPVSPENS